MNSTCSTPQELTELEQPSFSVGVEEGVCEVVPIILWDLKGFVLDAVEQVLQRR